MKSGIYKIICIVNNRCYIGSSVNLNNRINEHVRMLRQNKHHSIHLQRSWNKYKEENFIYSVVEFTTDLKIREQFYIDNNNPEFNISKNATSVMLNRKHSQETIEKFKVANKAHGKDHYLFGKKMTVEHKENLRLSRIGKTHSINTKLKMSETSKKLNRHSDLLPYIESQKRKIIDSNGIIHDSLVAAAKYHKISPATVCDILKGRHFQTRKKVSFKYV